MACRGSASEFRTSAGAASCIVGRLDPSLSVMSRAAKKFPRKPKKDNSEARRTQRRAESNRSGADGGAEGVGEGLAEALDIGFVFGLDHDAGELLGAGVAKDDAAIVSERGLRFGQRAGNLRQRVERRFRAHLHVDDELRIIL